MHPTHQLLLYLCILCFLITVGIFPFISALELPSASNLGTDSTLHDDLSFYLFQYSQQLGSQIIHVCRASASRIHLLLNPRITAWVNLIESFAYRLEHLLEFYTQHLLSHAAEWTRSLFNLTAYGIYAGAASSNGLMVASLRIIVDAVRLSPLTYVLLLARAGVAGHHAIGLTMAAIDAAELELVRTCGQLLARVLMSLFVVTTNLVICNRAATTFRRLHLPLRLCVLTITMSAALSIILGAPEFHDLWRGFVQAKHLLHVVDDSTGWVTFADHDIVE